MQILAEVAKTKDAAIPDVGPNLMVPILNSEESSTFSHEDRKPVISYIDETQETKSIEKKECTNRQSH